MFRAVREWWDSGRGKHAARLFGFELVVVMIGVLIAQQVSNWADRRAALNQVEGLHRDLYYSFDGYRGIATANLVAIRCLTDRADLILRLASSREHVDPSLLSPPTLLVMGPDQISPENEQLLRGRFGDKIADSIGSVQFNLRVAEGAGREIDRRWFAFQRLNPRYGGVSDDDRAAARGAAVDIKGSLFALRKSNENLLRLMTKLAVAHRPEMTIRPVSTCDEMWRTGRGYVDGH